MDEEQKPMPRRRLLVGLAILVAAAIAGAGAWILWRDRDRLAQGPCPSTGAERGESDCLAAMILADSHIAPTSPVALAADGTLVFVNEDKRDTSRAVLTGIAVAGGRPPWRVTLPAPGARQYVALAPAGNRAAVWQDGPAPLRILSLPDGALQAEIVLGHASLGRNVEPYFEVTFSPDGNFINTGKAGNRARFSVTDPSAAPMREPGFRNEACDSMTGQSNVGRVHSRDQKLAVLTAAPNTYQPLALLDQRRCGAEFLLNLHRSDAVPLSARTWFLSFAPDDRRLAVVYEIPASKRPKTVIEVRDTEDRTRSARLVSRIVVDGEVAYRIGWSPDGKRLALIRSEDGALEARIYAIP